MREELGAQDRRGRDRRRSLPLHGQRPRRGPVADHRRRDRRRQEDDRGPGGGRRQHRARARPRAGGGRSCRAPRAACRCPPGCSGPDAMFASPIARLVQQLGKLPGIGEKTAARLAFHILRASPEDAAALAAAIAEVKQKIRFCSVCCDLTEADPCARLPGRPPRRRPGVRGRAAPGRGRHRADGGLPRPLPRAPRGAVAPGRHRPRRSAGDGADSALRAGGSATARGRGGRSGRRSWPPAPASRGRRPPSTWRSCSARSACGPPGSPPASRSAASWSTLTR